MGGRRGFLGGLLASGLTPGFGWADAGDPAYLSAARLPSGDFALFGLDRQGATVFRTHLPGRGHAAAAHPTAPLAVVFARRPGTFALVTDCVTSAIRQHLSAPSGHHFSGHGAFSADGRLLFTGENNYDAARGVVGVWDTSAGFRRLGSFASGGIGPHDIRLMPDGQTLVVANGGIETHPDTGRAKLNLPIMRPNLSYVSVDGVLQDMVEPPLDWHKASLRHLAVRSDGLVAAAVQWQGDLSDVPPLLATHRRGTGLRFHDSAQRLERQMQGYAGSIAIAGDRIAITGPRGGTALIFSAEGRFQRTVDAADICGVAPGPAGLVFTTGTGRVLVDYGRTYQAARHNVNWDNHLIALP